MMLKVGEATPSFALIADDGTEVSLADFRGKKVSSISIPRSSRGSTAMLAVHSINRGSAKQGT